MLSTLVMYTGLIVGWLVIGYLAERFFPAEEKQPLRHLLFNVAYVPVYLVSLVILSQQVSSLLPQPTRALLQIDVGSTLIGAIAQTLLAFAIYDLFYYIWHRAQHTWAPLWEIHKLHHTERSLNASTAVRHHWLEETLRPIVVTLPVSYLLSVGSNTFWYLPFLFTVWPFFIHANLRIRSRLFSYVFVGPQYHRIHHSIEPQHWNRNFSAFFPLWDFVFKTAYVPKKNEFPGTGLTEFDGEAQSSLRAAANIPLRHNSGVDKRS
jgi:sterol desaturase/sphingolipid hydroxylase (fatty acid hydroxylase superfamily)